MITIYDSKKDGGMYTLPECIAVADQSFDRTDEIAHNPTKHKADIYSEHLPHSNDCALS